MPALTRAAARAVAVLVSLFAALVGLFAVLAVGAGPAGAEPPGRLAAQVTDTVGALSGAESEVDAALAELQSEAGIQLWVAYVATFDGLSGEEWTATTADLSGLGGNDMLFAVAVEDRAYGYDVAESFPLTDAEIDAVLARDVEPELIAGDWPGAVIALSTALAEATWSGSDSSGQSGRSGMGWLVAVLGVLVVAGAVVLLVRSRRKRPDMTARGPGRGPAGGAPEVVPLEELRKRAAAALIEADDSIRTSEQELGFAVAQFGDVEAEPFTAALAESRRQLQEAFGVQQRIEAREVNPADERAGLERIIALCREADERLDAQVDRFDALRDLERTLDTVLPGLATRTSALEERLPRARSTAQGLAARYAPEALATVQSNLEQAEQRIGFAREQVATGTQLLDTGDRNAAVTHARAAEEAIGQATTLLDAVDRAPDELAGAEAAIAALMTETRKDIAEAEHLGVAAELAGVHAHAAQTVTWAEQVIAAGAYDPLVARRALDEADAALERALGPARDAAAARQRAIALLATATDSARASIQAAGDFIQTRRGGVGAQARTQLSEAERHFANGSALVGSDPQAALQAMQLADQAADRALALAQQDEDRFRRGSGGGPGGMRGMDALVLGGILIDAMSRGGRGGGIGFPGGSGGWGGSGGSRPSSRGPGSFGGSGTRGRRSGGGRF